MFKHIMQLSALVAIAASGAQASNAQAQSQAQAGVLTAPDTGNTGDTGGSATAGKSQIAEGGNEPKGFDMAPETRPEVVAAAVASIPEKIPAGPVQPTWDSLKQNYQVPAWFEDARFGIFMHWGLYAVPAYHNDPRARPDNIIVCGTPSWSQRVDEASQDPLKSPNIAYTLHFYAAIHKQWLRDAATRAMANGVALFVTEWGTSEASGGGKLDDEETRKWWQFLDENHISWCNWSLADKTETSAALKPGAEGTGGWADDVISSSGLLVRQELRRQNPAPATAPRDEAAGK